MESKAIHWEMGKGCEKRATRKQGMTKSMKHHEKVQKATAVSEKWEEWRSSTTSNNSTTSFKHPEKDEQAAGAAVLGKCEGFEWDIISEHENIELDNTEFLMELGVDLHAIPGHQPCETSTLTNPGPILCVPENMADEFLYLHTWLLGFSRIKEELETLEKTAQKRLKRLGRRRKLINEP